MGNVHSSFDLSFVSAFGAENERLLFGVREAVRVTALSAIGADKAWICNRAYISAFSAYLDALRGRGRETEDATSSEIMCRVIERELASERKEQSAEDAFMSEHFHAFCASSSALERITVDVECVERCYEGMAAHLLSTTNPQIPAFAQFSKLHAQCRAMTALRAEGREALIVTSEGMAELLSLVRGVGDCVSSLEKVSLVRVALQCTDAEMTAFVKAFGAAEWSVAVSNVDGDDEVAVLVISRQ